MKTKKLTKKLELTKTTVANLNKAQMNQARRGGTEKDRQPSEDNTCDICFYTNEGSLGGRPICFPNCTNTIGIGDGK